MKVVAGCGVAARDPVRRVVECPARSGPGARRRQRLADARPHLRRAALQPARADRPQTSKELGLAWSFDTETTRGLEATPIVVDGVLYTTGSWSVVFAVDARTGKQFWKYDPEVPQATGANACCDVVNRGVAVYSGRVYVGTLDGRLAALDAETGKVLWQTVTVDQTQPYTITGAPRVVKGKVIIGNGGAEFGVRGYVSAYDAETGELVWRFYTVPGDPVEGRSSRRRSSARRRPGPASGGRSAAAARSGTRSPTIPSSTCSTSAPATARPGAAAAQPGRRRQPLSLLDPRAAARHRRARLALPDDARRHLGLHGDAAHDPRRPHDRRARRARC